MQFKTIISNKAIEIMKKFYLLAFAMIASMSVFAQEDEKVDAYFTTKEMPDMVKFLPAPPDTTSTRFVNDIMQYMWGKEQRVVNPDRAKIAERDAVYGLKTIIQEFSEPFGMEISETETPKIYEVLKLGTATCDSICTLPKEHYMRKRPYARFNEPTLVPEQEDSHRTNGSYPSGHTILGWSAALLLMEINPEAADTLMARGYMYGESRVIAGYHWQSDVDAARLAASVAYAKLHTSDRFLEQMAAARKEFAEKKASGVKTVIEDRKEINGRSYTLSGLPADETTKGIIIQDNKKYLRK